MDGLLPSGCILNIIISSAVQFIPLIGTLAAKVIFGSLLLGISFLFHQFEEMKKRI